MSNARLIETVAAATQYRDRDELDVALARLLFEFAEADRVTLSRVVGDGADARVRQLLKLERGAPEQKSDHASEVAGLPRLAERAAWSESVLLRDVVHYDTPGGALVSVFPLLSESDVRGLLQIESGNALDPAQAQLIMALLRVMRNYVVALDYGERDSLTGLLNRKTFESSFGKLRERNLRSAQAAPSWIGVVDIDRFKSINDNFGHLFGDEVLLLVSRQMRKQMRASDQLFRYGGEEFVVLIEGAGSDAAAAAYERIRAAVQAHSFPQVGCVTVSIGYSQVRPADAPSMAFERADKALYQAKQSGRNRVYSYETLAAQGLVAASDARSEVELF